MRIMTYSSPDPNISQVVENIAAGKESITETAPRGVTNVTGPGGVKLAASVQNAQRSRVAPTVNPAPTEASNTRLPFFNLPCSIAVFMARGMVAAVVLP